MKIHKMRPIRSVAAAVVGVGSLVSLTMIGSVPSTASSQAAMEAAANAAVAARAAEDNSSGRTALALKNNGNGTMSYVNQPAPIQREVQYTPEQAEAMLKQAEAQEAAFDRQAGVVEDQLEEAEKRVATLVADEKTKKQKLDTTRKQLRSKSSTTARMGTAASVLNTSSIETNERAAYERASVNRVNAERRLNEIQSHVSVNRENRKNITEDKKRAAKFKAAAARPVAPGNLNSRADNLNIAFPDVVKKSKSSNGYRLPTKATLTGVKCFSNGNSGQAKLVTNYSFEGGRYTMSMSNESNPQNKWYSSTGSPTLYVQDGIMLPSSHDFSVVKDNVTFYPYGQNKSVTSNEPYTYSIHTKLSTEQAQALRASCMEAAR